MNDANIIFRGLKTQGQGGEVSWKSVRAGYGKARFVREIASKIASKFACVNGALYRALGSPGCRRGELLRVWRRVGEDGPVRELSPELPPAVPGAAAQKVGDQSPTLIIQLPW